MKPFAYLVERHEGRFPAQGMLASLSMIGLHLERPKTADVFEWGDDGERLRTSRDALVARLSESKGATFDLWFSPDMSVGCSFRPVEPSIYGLGFDLWGLEADERQAIAAYTLERFRRLVSSSEAVMLVIDPTGESADFDWHDLVRGVGLPSAWPEIIGLEEARAAQVKTFLSGYRREPINRYVLFSKFNRDQKNDTKRRRSDLMG